MIKTIYEIPAPFTSHTIEVYGDSDNGYYEWRLVSRNGEILRDTKDQCYGNAEIALRDALIACS